MSEFLFDDEIFEENESDVDVSEDSSEEELEDLDQEESEEEIVAESESDVDDVAYEYSKDEDAEELETEPEVELDGKEEDEKEEELDIYSEDWPKVSFLSVDDDLFNASDAYKRHLRDYSFFLKFQKLNHVTHYVHNKEPFTHVYEKNYWKFTFFNKFCYFLRNRLSPLISSPFSFGGECPFFEFETLYSPQRCIAYSLRNRESSSLNLKRFSRSLQKFTADVYEDILIEGIDSDDSEIKLDRFSFSPGGVKFVDDIFGKDDVPQTKIDRHAWPSAYIERGTNRNL